MKTLRAEGLTKRFGEVTALGGVSLQLHPGDRHALIGPNGAGKTTLVNVLMGALEPDSGEVFLGEERLTALAQHERARRGLTRTFQVSTLFPGLRVHECVALAILEREGLAARWWRAVGDCGAQNEEASALLGLLGIAGDAARAVAELPYGRRRLLDIALALATRPSVLLLDEPAAGIGAEDSAVVLEAIRRLPRETTVLFIEHDMDLVFRFAERITVLVGGRVLAQGTPAEIAADERVRSVYLGTEAHA
jgi:branched-chain amino acid transport system ATP-binding protein